MDPVVGISIICSTVLAYQRASHSFLKKQRDHVDASAVSADLEEKLKDLAEVKKNVDTLMLRASILR